MTVHHANTISARCARPPRLTGADSSLPGGHFRGGRYAVTLLLARVACAAGTAHGEVSPVAGEKSRYIGGLGGRARTLFASAAFRMNLWIFA